MHACTDTCIAIHAMSHTVTCYITCYCIAICACAIHVCTGTCAGELYPTEVRTTAHGMSAGVAKMGALWATIWFNYSPLTVARSVM